MLTLWVRASVQFPLADSVSDWLKLAVKHRRAAEALMHDPAMRGIAWSLAGYSCECVLKAAIMAKERLNSWPSRSSRPDLWSHDLRALAKVLGATVTPADPVAPAWSIVVQWRREHTYHPNDIPEAVIRDLMAAAYLDKGVIPWISQSFLRNYMKPGETTTVS